MDVTELPLSRIVVSPNRRKPKPAMVNALAGSILEIGLQCPIGVVKDGKFYNLVHGRTRLEAFRSLDRQKIPAVVHDLDDLHAELAEIDENIQRCNLTAAEEAKALARRKGIYEALHPETKQGAKGGKGNAKPAANETDKMAVSFATDTAAKTGRSARSVRRDVAVGEKLSDKAVEVLADSPVADDKTQLKRLADLPSDQQDKVAVEIATGNRKSVPKPDKPDPSFPCALKAWVQSWIKKHGTASCVIRKALDDLAVEYT